MVQGCGSTVFAAGAGVVITAGSYFGWGNTVRIDHGDGVETLYGHMQWDSLRVAVGQHVAVGAPLGAEGSTGHSTGCHLHYEVRRNGVAIDPQPFMAVLGLPLK
jgi:murein DD-endopeptidase MepM/ murein hydrolase activator NlpD